MMTQSICIIDSGIGGLTIWQALSKLLPHEALFYIGDHAYIPYGNKSVDIVQERTLCLLDICQKMNPKLIIIACNTATVAGIDTYRKHIKATPIIGLVPVIKTAANMTKTGHIAVMSTVTTAKSIYQQELIHTFAQGKKVTVIACPNMVEYIEEGNTDTPEIEKELKEICAPLIGSDADTLVLGCTHYPFIKHVIQKIVGDRIQIIDSSGAVVRHAQRILQSNHQMEIKGKPIYQFMTTGDPIKVSAITSKLMHTPFIFHHLDV